MKKGEDGRRSFRATREAAHVDPENLAAYLKIDVLLEMKTAASNLGRLLSGSPGDVHEAKDVLASLERLIK